MLIYDMYVHSFIIILWYENFYFSIIRLCLSTYIYSWLDAYNKHTHGVICSCNLFTSYNGLSGLSLSITFLFLEQYTNSMSLIPTRYDSFGLDFSVGETKSVHAIICVQVIRQSARSYCT